MPSQNEKLCCDQDISDHSFCFMEPEVTTTISEEYVSQHPSKSSVAGKRRIFLEGQMTTLVIVAESCFRFRPQNSWLQSHNVRFCWAASLKTL